MVKQLFIISIIIFGVGLVLSFGYSKSKQIRFLISKLFFLDREEDYTPLRILGAIGKKIVLFFILIGVFNWIVETFFVSYSKYGLIIFPLLVLLWWIYVFVHFFYKYEEIKGSSKKAIDSKIKTNQLGFYLNCDEGKIIINNPFRGIFISGGAGSGKSKSIVEPLIYQSAKKHYSGIVYDFKFPTLANEVKGSYQNSEVKPYYINFTDLSKTYRVNPLSPDIITNVTFARQAAITIISNIDSEAVKKRDFWVQSAEAVLTATIWYLRKNYPQYCTLPHVISLILEVAPDSLIDLLLSDEETSGLIASVNSARKSDNTIASILATIQNYLSVLNTKEIFWVLGGEDFSLNLNDPLDPKMLVVGNDDSVSKAISPAIALIISSSLKQLNKPDKQHSIIILDEAPTIKLPNFAQIPATGRVNKVATVYCVQDISQMDNDLGKEQSETILSNLGTQFFGRTTNVETASRVSKLFGEYDKEISGSSKSTSHKRGMLFRDTSTSVSATKSISIQRRKVLEDSQLITADVGEFATIVSEGNTRKIFAKYKAGLSQASTLDSFTHVSDEALSDNFKKIKDDIFSI